MNISRKQLILRMVEKLPEDVPYDRVVYHLEVMKAVEIGLKQAERGEVVDHDEVLARSLEDEEEGANRLDATSARRPGEHPASRRSKRSANGGKIRKPAQKRSKQPARVS